MIDAGLVAFLPVAALLTITPGADMALVTAHSLRYGSRETLWTILGICSGVIVQGAASGLGLAAIVAASSQVFTALKLIGAGYLVFLGVQSFISASTAEPATAEQRVELQPAGARRRFREGLLSNVLNPKVTVFYLALLPQFISPGQPVVAKSILLGTIHAVMGVVWLVGYSRAVVKASARFERSSFRKWMQRVSGAALIGLGVTVATARR
jgi:RhtB (resistance to homoserine/threonine) family protein